MNIAPLVIAAGAASGAAGNIISEQIDNLKQERTEYDVLCELLETEKELSQYLRNTPANKRDIHESILTYLARPIIVTYRGYLGIYMLFPQACTFTVQVSGLFPFTWTPSVGVYNRWRYPDRTTLLLLTPSANPQFVIDVLHTDDLSSN